MSDTVTTPEASTAAAPAPAAPEKGATYTWGTGRRKTAVARVRIRPGAGKIVINQREFKDYFPRLREQNVCLAPLRATEMLGKLDVFVNVGGGGPSGQSGAISLGVARALASYDSAHEPTLRDRQFLTRDSREVERKKYGQPGARRRFQFSKR